MKLTDLHEVEASRPCMITGLRIKHLDTGRLMEQRLDKPESWFAEFGKQHPECKLYWFVPYSNASAIWQLFVKIGNGEWQEIPGPNMNRKMELSRKVKEYQHHLEIEQIEADTALAESWGMEIPPDITAKRLA